MKTITYMLIVWVTMATYAAADVPTLRLSVRVVTPDGIPVQGAAVGIGGGLTTSDDNISRTANGRTDSQGVFTATIRSAMGVVSAYVEAPGFYETELSGYRLVASRDQIASAHRNGRWHPWERTVTLVLKPVIRPVPMFAKRFEGLVPGNGVVAGFDLAVGDWVSPYGVGKVTDLQIQAIGIFQSKLNYSATVTLAVPGVGNGIQAVDLDSFQRSRLVLPHAAPSDGYAGRWTWRNSRQTKEGEQSTFVDDTASPRGYIIRVRSVVDGTGRVVQSDFGKIQGPVFIQAFEGGKTRIGFILLQSRPHSEPGIRSREESLQRTDSARAGCGAMKLRDCAATPAPQNASTAKAKVIVGCIVT